MAECVKKMRTLEEIEQCGKNMLSPADVCGFLGCDPYDINVAVKTRPESVRFPYTKIGNRVKIPRVGFVNWARGIRPEEARRR